LNCRDATLLIEKKLVGSTSNPEELDLKLHLANCAGCRLFEQQRMMINLLVRQLFHEQQLDDECKKKIQARIEK
jgi:hypothetical protein